MIAVISLLSFLFFSSVPVDNQMYEMINESILLYLDWQSESINKTIRESENHDLYICMDNYPENISFSEDVLKKHIKFINRYDFSRRRELQKKKEYKFIFPAIQLDNNQIRITIFGKIVSYRNKQLHIAMVDWCVTTYEYSCNEQKWNLKETTVGGI